MLTLQIRRRSRPLIRAISNWWSNRIERNHVTTQLKCSAEEEIERIANDASHSIR